MTFPRQRAGERALQAVEVLAARRPGDAAGSGVRPYKFTFCLERVEQGPYKVRPDSIAMALLQRVAH